MNVLYLFIIIQIVLESFPVSSSGHVRLFELAGFNAGIIDGMHDELFQHFLHGPTLLILTFFFWHRWIPLLLRLNRAWPMIIRLVLLVGIADVLTALWYWLYNQIDISGFPLGIGFCITAATLASLRFCTQSLHQRFSSKHAVILGMVQGVALLPGISRMAVTYAAARWMRFSPRAAFELSCAIEWPLIAAAFVKSITQLILLPETDSLRLVIMSWPTMVVIVISSVVSWFCLCLTQQWMLRNTIWRLAYYMVIPCIAWVMLRFYS